MFYSFLIFLFYYNMFIQTNHIQLRLKVISSFQKLFVDLKDVVLTTRHIKKNIYHSSSDSLFHRCHNELNNFTHGSAWTVMSLI